MKTAVLDDFMKTRLGYFPGVLNLSFGEVKLVFRRHLIRPLDSKCEVMKHIHAPLWVYQNFTMKT